MSVKLYRTGSGVPAKNSADHSEMVIYRGIEGSRELIDPILGNDASWWWVASDILIDSQHPDATSGYSALRQFSGCPLLTVAPTTAKCPKNKR